MTEVEVKFLDIDTEAVVRRLDELGASKVFDGNMQASHYDFSDGRLDKENSFVRLRTKGDTIEFAFKRKIAGDVAAKSYEELEVAVNDRVTAHKILEELGLRETVHGRNKHRASYALDDAHFELDTFDGMPTFLEIEVSHTSRLAHWCGLLGLSMEDAKPWSGKEVYAHYGIEYPRV